MFFFFLKLVTKQPGLYLFNSYNTFDQKNPKVSVTSDNLPSLGMHVLKGINCETKPSTSIRDSVAHHISLFVGRLSADAFYWITFPPTHSGLFCIGVEERSIILIVLSVSFSLQHTSPVPKQKLRVRCLF